MIKKILIVFCIIVLMGTRTFAQTMLYHTDFSPSQTTLSAPYIMHAGTGAYQPISGIDVATGQQGPMIPMGASISFLDMIAGDPVRLSTLGNYITNTIEQIPGPDGSTVYALNQNIIQNFAPQGKSTQDALMIFRDGGLTDIGDVYYTYWFKLPSDVHTQLGIIDGIDNWRVMSEWKTGGSTDYRIITIVKQDSNGKLFWYNEGGGWNDAGSKSIYWTFNNTTVPVPVGTWFKYEVFWHRSTPGSINGRYWAAVNGQVIVDHSGPLYPTIDGTEYGQVIANPQLIDRIFLNNAYSGGGSPVQQWTTGLEIWDGFPKPDINTAPEAYDQNVTAAVGADKVVMLIGGDANGDTLTFTIVANPAHGTLTGSGASRTYTPTAGYIGTDSFSFKANDGMVDSNTATVSITISSPALITTSATSVMAGASLTATVSNGPGNPGDWVGFYPVDVPFSFSVAYKTMNDTQTQPTTGITSAILHFTAVNSAGAPAKPGQYNFRLYNGRTLALEAISPTITVDTLATNVSINRMDSKDLFYVHPNPFYKNFNLTISSGIEINNAKMKIYNIIGKEIKNVSIKNHETVIERDKLKSGMYFYSIGNKNKLIGNGKLVVQ